MNGKSSSVLSSLDDMTISDGPMVQYLGFSLGSDLYAAEILSVREIRAWESVRALPDMPHAMLGVLSFREGMVPVVDLRLRFGVSPARYEPTTVIIVFSCHMDSDEQLIAVVVDGVSDVLDVAPAMRQPIPEMGHHIDTRYMDGMVRVDNEVVVLLNIENLLNPDELMRFENAAEAQGRED